MEFCLLKKGMDCQVYHALKSLYCDPNHVYAWEIITQTGLNIDQECDKMIISLQHYLPCLPTTSSCNRNISRVKFIVAPLNRTFFCMQYIALLAENEGDMDAMLDVVSGWCRKWLLRINVLKF